MDATSRTVMYVWDLTMGPRSFNTQVLHSGCGADRWIRFLSSGNESLDVATWWREHSRVWESRATTRR